MDDVEEKEDAGGSNADDAATKGWGENSEVVASVSVSVID